MRVDGHVIDLVQAAAEQERQREEPAVIVPPAPASIATAILYDLDVARNVAVALSRPLRPCAECHDPGCCRSTYLTLTDRATGEEYRATKCEEAALRREVMPPLAEPAIAAPPPDDASAYRCPWCSRPWDGAK